jgi:hypothetical protein
VRREDVAGLGLHALFDVRGDVRLRDSPDRVPYVDDVDVPGVVLVGKVPVRGVGPAVDLGPAGGDVEEG